MSAAAATTGAIAPPGPAEAAHAAPPSRGVSALLFLALALGIGTNARVAGSAPVFSVHLAIAAVLGCTLFACGTRAALGVPVRSRAMALLTVWLLLCATVWGVGEPLFVPTYLKLATILLCFYGFLVLFTNWRVPVAVVVGALSAGALIATVRRLGVRGIVTQLVGISIQTRVGSDEFGGNNAYAFFLALAIVGLLFLAGQARTRLRAAAFLVAVPYLFLHLLATLSRGGMLALVIGVAALYASQARSPIRALATIGTLAAAVGAVVVLLIPDLVVVRERFDVTSDPTGSGRTGIWSALLTDLAETPLSLLVGKGTGSVALETPWARLESAHSSYLEALYQYGAIGLALALALAVRVVRAVWQLPPGPERAVTLAITLQIVIGSLVDSYHGAVQVGWLYGYWFAFVWPKSAPAATAGPSPAADSSDHTPRPTLACPPTSVQP